MNIEVNNGRLLINKHDFGEVLREVDGFYVWYPATFTGYLSQEVCAAITDKLKELNAPWQADINAYFDRDFDREE